MVGKKLIPEEKTGMEDTCKFAKIDEKLMEEKKKYKTRKSSCMNTRGIPPAV